MKSQAGSQCWCLFKQVKINQCRRSQMFPVETCQCGKVAPLRCSQCQHRYYCSRECQRADHPMHKELCAVLEYAPLRLTYFDWFLQREPEIRRLVIECGRTAQEGGLVVVFGLVWNANNKLRAFISPRELTGKQRDQWAAFLADKGDDDVVFMAARSPTGQTLALPHSVRALTPVFWDRDQVEVLEKAKTMFSRSYYDQGCTPLWVDWEPVQPSGDRVLTLTPVVMEQYENAMAPAESHSCAPNGSHGQGSNQHGVQARH